MGRLKKGIRLTIIFILAIGYSLANAQQTIPRFEPGKCPFETQSPLDGLECGKLIVYENRDDPAEGTLHLAVAILHSYSENPEPDPLVFPAGGPGNANVVNTPRYASWDFFNQYRQQRDIILYDQRGTGYSDPAFCPELNQLLSPMDYSGDDPEQVQDRVVSATQDCRDKMLARGVDFSRYNSATSVSDLNDLRKTLGYQQWNILSGSYSARLALTAMRDMPKGIRSVILDATNPPNVRNWVQIPQNFRRSLNLVFEQCMIDESCQAAFPELESNVYNTIQKLEEDPIVMAMEDTTRFPEGRVVLDGDLFIEALFGGLYNRNFIPLIPLFVKEIRESNTNLIQALVNQMAPVTQGPRSNSRGLQYAVYCFEDLPFNPKSLIDSAQNKYPRLRPWYSSGAPRWNRHAICEEWHNVHADSNEFQPVHSKIPALILAGEFDPITPPSYGRIAAKTLHNSSFIEVPALGHGTMTYNQCTRDLVSIFLDSPSEPLDTSCVTDLPPVSFITDVHINGGIYPMAQQIKQGSGPPFLAGLGLIGLLLLTGVLTWSIGHIVKRLRGKKLESKSMHKIARWVVTAASLLGLGFIIGLGYAIQHTASVNPLILAFGLIGSYSWVFLLPWLLAILTLVLMGFAITAWHNKWWSILHRCHFTLITLACIGLISFIGFWDLM
ncbi:hypothetical protein CK503_08885 [Aliifodinibius salipaludis]|uniref:Proline iminopeptidase n=1 Tax=Fodinibius salipaludis TaxID=2032627 RepID=A0A2A2GAA5_9BACT|nr:alpha/beta fold hydrolase [Aliifodinibius salipaludis]PAU93779.1 hypothetical protein CK503_08885 [Aliifodinibius salipaludis]